MFECSKEAYEVVCSRLVAGELPRSECLRCCNRSSYMHPIATLSMTVKILVIVAFAVSPTILHCHSAPALSVDSACAGAGAGMGYGLCQDMH